MRELTDLSDAEQQALLDALTYHAWCGMRRRLRWRGAKIVRRDQVAPGGMGPDDFALEAIERFLDNKRIWNRDAYPDLLDFLRSVVDSLISNAVTAVENQRSRQLVPRRGDQDLTEVYDPTVDNRDPLYVLLDREWLIRFAQVREDIRKELEGDALLSKLFECLEAGITAPSEIADVIGVSVDDVNNAKKRLKRKVDKLDVDLFRPRRRTGP